jgi:hypothetical protein
VEFTFGLEKKQMHLFDQFSLMIHVLLAIKKPMKHKKNQPDKSQWCNGSDEMRRKIHVVFRSSGKAEKLSGIPFLDFRGRTEFHSRERNSARAWTLFGFRFGRFFLGSNALNHYCLH